MNKTKNLRDFINMVGIIIIIVGILLFSFYIVSSDWEFLENKETQSYGDWMASKHINKEGTKVISFDIKDYLTTINFWLIVPFIFGIGIVLILIANKVEFLDKGKGKLNKQRISGKKELNNQMDIFK